MTNKKLDKTVREQAFKLFKTDVKSQDSLTTYVKYEIYDPYNFTQLNLSYCKI